MKGTAAPVALLALPVLVALAGLPAAGAASGGCGGPPCGYITPILDLDFPDKPKCPGAPGSVELSKCIPLMAPGASVVMEGTVRWYWKMSEDLTYPPDPGQPIVIAFSGTASNPKWLTFEVDPPQFTIDAAALFDPQNMPVEGAQAGSPVVYYSFERPIKVTLTRSGEPSPSELGRVVDREGLQSVFVKARSTESGAYFREAFGVEEFRFNATAMLSLGEGRTAPASLLALLLGLAVAATVAARRRG